MEELFSKMKESLLSKTPVILVTIIESSGSVPRSAGARMLVAKGQGETAVRLWGSIGGGLPEYLAIEEAGRLLQGARHPPATSLRKYMLRPNEAAALGIVCGGEISVFSRLMDAGEPGLLELVEKGISAFKNASPSLFIMETSENAQYPGLEIAAKDNPSFASYEKPFCEPLHSGGFVYVFGGGHIAQDLVPLLSRLDFRCIVFDDREEFAAKDIFPEAERIILGDFARIANHLTLTAEDFVVIITRGHQWDLEVFAFALDSPAAYIGVIGSKAKHEFVKGKLRERGFESAVINAARVHAPIGIDIKSESPAEIAVSIAAELVLVRNLAKASRKSISPVFSREGRGGAKGAK